MTVHNDNLNKKSTLHPLRIPMKWTISYNMFFESDDPELFTDETSSYRFNFNEDILQLEKNGLLVDLGWYPEHSINGCYTLQLIKYYDWGSPIFMYNSRNKANIVNKLE